MRVALAIWLIVVATASNAAARPVRVWSYAALWSQADLVVVASHLKTSDDQRVRYSKPSAMTWVRVLSQFKVVAVLKGQHVPTTMNLAHYRYFDPKMANRVIDGPVFVRFTPKLKGHYLLFLKRTGKGDYRPVTGQYDPHGAIKVLRRFHH